MVAKKKTVSKEKKEETIKTPEAENKKVVVEEVAPTEESTESEAPLEIEVPVEKNNRKLFRAGLIVVLFIFGVTGWVFYLTSRYSQKTTKEEITLEETAETPTATPAPTQLEREEITLEILNGSGVAGAAADATEIFEALGYEVVETGNADATEGNELYVDPDAEELIEILLEDVEDELDISSISGELDDSDVSARIILGE